MASNDRNTAVTADAVAPAAGVSRWTVPHAFKADASVSGKFRRKVIETAARLGYTPDLHAAGLASDRSNLVLLLVNPHRLEMPERLTCILRRHGGDTLLVNTPGAQDAPAVLLNASQRRVDAAVLIGCTSTRRCCPPGRVPGGRVKRFWMSLGVHCRLIQALSRVNRGSDRAGARNGGAEAPP